MNARELFREVTFRLIHWGPIIALSIIKIITLTCLSITQQWLKPSQSFIGAINHLIYLILIGTTLYNFFCAMFIGPGYVPLQWTPEEDDDRQYLQYCQFCEGFKAPRAHHCRKCQRCVMKMDHHCPWINNCCGYRNHANFTYFLLSAVLGSIHSAILLINAVYRGYYINWYYYNDDRSRLVFLSLTSFMFCILSIGLAIGVIIAVGGLFIIQAKIMLRNKTSIEEWIVTKAISRKRDDVFVYPYDLGWKNNIKQSLFETCDNGFTWPIVEGCDQFTLTTEQILQKEEKRIHASQFKVISNYNGQWFPIFSQGCKVCLNIPISDEPRITLTVNDMLLVTRWKKQWLYGEIMELSLNYYTDNYTRRRGWFPRKCVVEVITPVIAPLNNLHNQNISDNSITNNKKLN